jgi:hypothetical protein
VPIRSFVSASVCTGMESAMFSVASTELDFIREISPDDRMMRRSDPDRYYRVGLSALSCVEAALQAAISAQCSSLLFD